MRRLKRPNKVMASFSDHSKSELETLHSDLQTVMREVIKYYDFRILEGYRGRERQNRMYRQGKSQLQYPESKHNKQPSRAVDIAPYPIDWNDLDRFYQLSGFVLGIAAKLQDEGRIIHDIRWGGDWDEDHKFDDQTFNDLPHFELDE